MWQEEEEDKGNFIWWKLWQSCWEIKMYNRAAATVAINGTHYYKKWTELK